MLENIIFVDYKLFCSYATRQRQNHLEGYEVCILANHVPLLSKKNVSSPIIQ